MTERPVPKEQQKETNVMDPSAIERLTKARGNYLQGSKMDEESINAEEKLECQGTEPKPNSLVQLRHEGRLVP